MLYAQKLNVNQKIVPTQLFKDLLKHNAKTLIQYSLHNSLASSYEIEFITKMFVNASNDVVFCDNFFRIMETALYNVFTVNKEVWKYEFDTQFALAVYAAENNDSWNTELVEEFIKANCPFDHLIDLIKKKTLELADDIIKTKSFNDNFFRFYVEVEPKK